MDFDEKIGLRAVLWDKLFDLTGNAFEDFFHEMMCLCVPGFVDVRTHGRVGDQGSDGLSLHDNKLYACYAPEVPSAAATIKKFKSDLASAIAQRTGQFDTFVFVHNDVRGVHPEVAAALAEARTAHPELKFELMGSHRIRNLLGSMERGEVETLLRRTLPLAHDSSLGLDELEDLLGHLGARSVPVGPSQPIEVVSSLKLAYSDLSEDTKADLRDAMKHSPTIEAYYEARSDVEERDEVAALFSFAYREAREETADPEAILDKLQIFLGGERMKSRSVYRAQTAVLAYFFQTCDIFENPPANWSAPETLAAI